MELKSKLFPWKNYESVLDVDYNHLKEQGIKVIMFDVDNTILSRKVNELSVDFLNLVEDLKKMDFSIWLISNNRKGRVSPVARQVGLDYVCWAIKPIGGIRRILKRMEAHKGQIVIVGDQIFTDILGGNLHGIKTVLVKQTSAVEGFQTKALRRAEKFLKRKYPEKYACETL